MKISQQAGNSRVSLEQQAAEIARLQEQMRQLTTEKEQPQMKEIAPAEEKVVRSHSRPEVSVYVSTIVYGIGEQTFVQYCRSMFLNVMV